MVTGSTAVLALGFVVAVAARDLPGERQDEPGLDVALRVDLDLTPLLAWLLLVLALLGAVLFAVGMREAKPRDDTRRRNLLGALIGIILFVAIFRWVRPAALALFDEGSSVANPGSDEVAATGARSAAGWLFSLLLAAILAATLTRIGLSIKSIPSPYPLATDGPAGEAVLATAPDIIRIGADPRSRILVAYAQFESEVAASGEPRRPTETTRRHARRAGRLLGLDPGEVDDLVEHHARARYGRSVPTDLEASSAERTSKRLRERLRE